MFRVYSPDGSTLLGEMTPWPPSWNYDIKAKIWLHQSTHIYLKNNPAKFHPDSTWNDGSLGFSKAGRPNKKKKNKNKSSDMRSVPDLEINAEKTMFCGSTYTKHLHIALHCQLTGTSQRHAVVPTLL